MSLNVKELTTYIKEVQRAKNSLDKLLDFADLMIKDNDKIDADLAKPANEIKDKYESISSSIEKLDKVFNDELNKIPVDENEIIDAAEKLILYHGDAMQLLISSEQQRVNYKEGSYWWNYWEGISKIAREQVEKSKNSMK